MLDGQALCSSWKDLGALQFLLAVQDDEALRLYTDSVLGPIESGEGEYGGELLRSLEAFVEHNGQWERAARSFSATGTPCGTGSGGSNSSPDATSERARPDRVLARPEGTRSW